MDRKGVKEGNALDSAKRVKQACAGQQQLSLFSAHCAAQSLQRPFFARAPEGQMWPGSWCWDVHRQIVETEWSDAREWCMGAGQDRTVYVRTDRTEEAQRGRAAFKLPQLSPDKLLITAAARIR